MASITNRVLKITHDHKNKTANPIVTCTVNFSVLELCQMKNCPEARFFKLKCSLLGSDPVSDDKLYTYNTVYFFPDSAPSASENRMFDATVGEGMLDEDWNPPWPFSSYGTDEIYGQLSLYNLATGGLIRGKTNEVHHNF